MRQVQKLLIGQRSLSYVESQSSSMIMPTSPPPNLRQQLHPALSYRVIEYADSRSTKIRICNNVGTLERSNLLRQQLRLSAMKRLKAAISQNFQRMSLFLKSFRLSVVSSKSCALLHTSACLLQPALWQQEAHNMLARDCQSPNLEFSPE